MKRLIMTAMCLSVSMSLYAETECEDAVDMADSLDFHAMHVDCSKDPITLYDKGSKASVFSTKSKAVTAYDASQPQVTVVKKVTHANAIDAPQNKPMAIPQQAVIKDNAGITFNIREPFTLTGGPQSALNGLYVQMAKYCPDGWTKNQEWVKPAQVGYFLHYQFVCAE